MPLISTPTVKCDCERQFPETSSDTGQPETERAASKQKPEEVFTSPAFPALSNHLMASLSTEGLFIPRKVLAGVPSSLFQPPRWESFVTLI